MVENPTKTFSFADTTATKKVFALRKRIRAIAGGTSASKTISILIWLIDYCQTRKNKLASVVSESYPHLSGGAIRDFKGIMKDRGYWDDGRWNETKHIYRFETGCELEFTSPDTYGKAHGPRRDVLFINEANNLDYKIADQLIVRTREIVWMDWNPTSEFWFYTEMLPNRPDDIDFITLTYKDNEALDPVTVQEIESHKNRKGWWTGYGEGKLGEVEGKIYNGWKIIDDVPHEARLERFGLNFGYTGHPAAIVAIYYLNGGYILDELAYSQGLLNRMLADIINSQPRKALTVADSAEPKSIDDLKELQVSIVPAEKGQDSVRHGIEVVQDQQISITRRSVNVIREYRNYLWKYDKNGKMIEPNEPEEPFHYSMDAVRYGITSLAPIKRREEFIKNMPRMERKPKPNPAR